MIQNLFVPEGRAINNPGILSRGRETETTLRPWGAGETVAEPAEL